MRVRKLIVTIITIAVISGLSGCALGMLLFYKDVRTTSVYRSRESRKNYYEIEAVTLSHCGCSYLTLHNYSNKKVSFRMFFNYETFSGKTIYSFNPVTNRQDTIRYLATTEKNFSVPFDSLDQAIFSRFNAIAKEKPKGVVYDLPQRTYTGYVRIYQPVLY